jgi:hypothetical protein
LECLGQLASLNPKDQNSQGTCASHGHPSPSCHDFRTLSDCQLRNAQSQAGLWQSKSKRWLGNNGPHRCARIQDLASVRPTQLEQILEQVPRTMLLIDLPIDESVIHPSLPPSIHPSTVSTAYPLRQVQPWIESTSPARHLEFLRRSTSWHVSHKCNILSRQPLMNSIIFKTQISIRLPVCCFAPAKTLSFGGNLHIERSQCANFKLSPLTVMYQRSTVPDRLFVIDHVHELQQNTSYQGAPPSLRHFWVFVTFLIRHCFGHCSDSSLTSTRVPKY